MNSINLINFTELSLKQKKMVLLWRNYEGVRQWMINFELIPLKEHLSFIETLNKSTQKTYFLVQYNKKDYGVIYLTNINVQNSSAELGIYANPNLHGVGKILMSALIDYAQTLKIKTLIADVFNNNEKAKHLYKIFNFSETQQNINQEKAIVRLECTL